VPAEIWKDGDVDSSFLTEPSQLIPERARELDVMLRVIRCAPCTPGRVLDLGCGDAILLSTILQAFPETTGVALDFSSLMLERARCRLASCGGRATTLEADLGNPDWRKGLAGPFDAIVSGFAIHHLPDARKRALYGEVHDLLRPGGVFLNAEHVASATPRIEAIFNDAMADHLYQRRRERGEDVTFEQVKRDLLERPDRAANILAPVEEQCAWLRELGFRDVDCYWKYFELAIFGGVRG